MLKHQNTSRRACPGVQDGGGGGEVPEHKNEPMWACSCVQDEGKEEGRCPSTRTCLCGHFLVFETGETERRGA